MEYPKQLLGQFKSDYHRYGKFNLEVQVPHLVKLAEFYERRYKLTNNWTDCVKANALYNSINRREPQSLWEERAFKVQQDYWTEKSSLSQDDQHALNTSLRSDIESIREKFRNDILVADELANKFDGADTTSEIVEELFVCMKNISLDCSDAMSNFAERIIRESVSILGPSKPPCEFAAVAIGSLARGEATPYSDLEFLFLVEQKSPDIMKYFENLAITSYFQIGNLGETRLSYMAIDELKGWFDDQAKNGFKIDVLTDQAGNIPTGNGSSHQHNHLIVTPDELAKKYRNILDKPDKEEALRGDLTAMLTYMKPLFSYKSHKDNLVDKLQGQIRNYHINIARHSVNLEMLQTDISKFNLKPSIGLLLNGLNADVKREVYRFPSILLLDINIIKHIYSDSSWQSLKLLHDRNQISAQLHRVLSFLLASATYMRLSAYLYHDSQDNRISVSQQRSSSRQGSETKYFKSLNRWFVPIQLFTKMCKNLLLLQWTMSKSNEIESTLKTLQMDDNDPWAEITTLFYSGRYIETLDVLRREYGDNICEDPLTVIQQVSQDKDVDEIWFFLSETLFSCSEFKAALIVYENMPPNNSIENRVRTADCYRGLGNYCKSVEILESITAKSNYALRHSLGQSYLRNKDYEKSEQSLLEALEISLCSAMPDHVNGDLLLSFKTIESPEERLTRITYTSHDIISCVTLLGAVYCAQSQYTLSNSYNETALQLLMACYGARAAVPIATDVLTCLGYNCRQMRCYGDAVDHYTEALKVFRVLPPGTADIKFADTITSLGSCLTAAGRHDVAITHYKQSLVEVGELLTKPSTSYVAKVNILINQGAMLREMGQYGDSVEPLTHALAMQSKGGTNYEDIAITLRWLGSSYFNIGWHSEAIGYNKQALATFRKCLDDDEPSNDIAQTLSNIGASYITTARYQEAEDHLMQAVSSYRSLSHGRNKDGFAQALHNLGIVKNALGQYKDAAIVHKQSLDMYTDISEGFELHSIAEILSSISKNCCDMGLHCDAVKHNMLAISAHRKLSMGERNIDLAHVLSHLGLIYNQSEQFIRAEYYFDQSLAIYRELSEGAPSSDIARTLSNLGTNYMALDDTKAIGTLREAVHMFMKTDPGNPQIRELRHKLRYNLNHFHLI